MHDDNTDSKIIANQIIAAWGNYVSEHLSSGWETYLLSFMFEPLPGSQQRKMAQMARLLEAAYGIFVTRVVRKPRTAGRRGIAPIWLCSPDLPVFKREKRDKARLRDLEINDGLHYHAVLLMPPRSRLRDVNGHFYKLRRAYAEHAQLNRVDVEPITHDDRYVVGYVQKQSARGTFDVGDNFALPRSLSELPTRRLWAPPVPRQAGERVRPAVLSAVRR